MGLIRFTLLSIVFVATTAAAEPVNDFGARGQIIFSADRLSPLISYTRVKEAGNNPGEYTTTSQTSMSLLWSGTPQDFYDIPRVGIDYGIAAHLTLGGSLFATLPMSSSSDRTQNGQTQARDTTKTSAAGLGARVGYVIPLTATIAFWPRGGLSYARVTQTTTSPDGTQQDSTTVSQPALDLEPLFVIQPAPHWGIVIGPAIDLPLGGSAHTETTDQGQTQSFDTDTSQLHVGITVGMLGWL